MIDLACRSVSKRYRPRGASASLGEFWALRDVSFEVCRSEAVGVIGANGAGKSTLLRLIAGITAPTEGEMLIDGRLAALIDIGSGFHPELTGRENVYLNGAILGMTRREIERKFDDIVSFAGVTAFIDVPVKWYSSGMYVRLGFAIAAHVEPDILLIDEVLAVGDLQFQQRCLARVRELRRAGTTALFISHDLEAVEQLCDRVLLLDRGRVVQEGAPATVIRTYRERLVSHAAVHPPNEGSAGTGAGGSGNVAIRGIDLNMQSHTAVVVRTGYPLSCRVEYAAMAACTGVAFEVSFYSADGRTLMWEQTTELDAEPLQLSMGTGAVEFSCDSVPLQPGRYAVAVSCRDTASQQVVAWLSGPVLDVQPGKMVRGFFYAPHRWRHVA